MTELEKELDRRAKIIIQLQKQIEKMKCCQNCEHRFYNGLHYICCDLHEPKGEPLTSVRRCSRWKLEEVIE